MPDSRMDVPGKKWAGVSAGHLAYVEHGPGDGPAVLLLHGFPTSSHLWRDYLPVLTPSFRVIAPDLLGHGDSDKPEEAPLGIQAQAGYVRELLGLLGIRRFAVVGHGLGGGVAQLLAIDGSGVEAMILIDTVAFDAWPSEFIREIQSMDPDRYAPQVRAIIGTSFDLGMGRRSRLGENALEEYVRPFHGDEGARAFLRSARAIDGAGLAGREGDLARLACPVLIMWGEDDPFLPAELAERLSEAIPTSALALLPECSHFVTEDAPEAVAPLLFEYLRARYLGQGHSHGAPGPVMLSLERRTSPTGEGGAT